MLNDYLQIMDICLCKDCELLKWDYPSPKCLGARGGSKSPPVAIMDKCPMYKKSHDPEGSEPWLERHYSVKLYLKREITGHQTIVA